VTLLPVLVGGFGARLPSGDVSGRHINDAIEPAYPACDEAVAALRLFNNAAGAVSQEAWPGP
jgi:hypothetical protein